MRTCRLEAPSNSKARNGARSAHPEQASPERVMTVPLRATTHLYKSRRAHRPQDHRIYAVTGKKVRLVPFTPS